MKKFLEHLVREFNPEHDFDNFIYVDSEKIRGRKDREEILENIRKYNTNLYIFKGLKNLARGFSVGGLVGYGISATYAYFSGEDHTANTLSGMLDGMTMGMIVDPSQFMLRSIYYKIKYNIP